MRFSGGRHIVTGLVRSVCVRLIGMATAAALVGGAAAANAQSASTAASAAASPSPRATPAQAVGTVHVAVDAHTTFISQSTNGAGTNPPEGPAFIAGSPAAPLSPYDTFSSAPMTPGNADESALYVTPTYAGKAFTASARFGIGDVFGSVTNAS
jgi:hypothetical protein